MAKIENFKYTIEEAFRDCFYIVPDYQREYVWTDKEVLQLLDDINEQIDSPKGTEYFIGTVLVSPTSEKNHFEVIDGQQRLTTFFLILCALKHLFKGDTKRQSILGLVTTTFTTEDGETQTSMKLDPRYENASDVMQVIVDTDADPVTTRNAIQAAGIAYFGSLEKLLNALETIHNYFKSNYDDPVKLKKYWGYLANKVVFIQISTDISSALKIFETINERGVGLNPMDLLKNLLFTQVTPKEFTKLRDEWKKVTKPLEKAKEKPLRFLRYFLMANYKIEIDRGEKEKNDAVVREDEIYDWFTDKDNAKVCNYKEEPFKFVQVLNNNVTSYLEFSEGKGNDGKDNIAMANLKLLSGGAFSLHYVLLLAVKNYPKELFNHFVKQLESFLFYYIFTKTPTKELERNFSIWADELRAIGTEKDKNKQKTKLNAFVNDRFKKSMDSKETELNDALNRYTLYSMQQYRTRYLLAKLTQHVDIAYKGLKYPGSLAEYTSLEIEHILPNTPEDELLNDFEKNNPGEKYEEAKIRLGNLTLLEKPINIVAGNDFFDLKLPKYKQSKNYLTSSINELANIGKNSSITRINKRLKSFDEWTMETIRERQKLLIQLTKDIWTITKAE